MLLAGSNLGKKGMVKSGIAMVTVTLIPDLEITRRIFGTLRLVWGGGGSGFLPSSAPVCHMQSVAFAVFMTCCIVLCQRPVFSLSPGRWIEC